jgi:cytochrome c-type biogenesis protein CcmH/NrfG
MTQRVFAIVFLAFLFTGISRTQDNEKDLQGVLAQKPNDVETLMKLGKIYHDQGVAGNDDAVDKGFTCFDKVLQIDPANAVALVYRGSFWTLRARDAWWPFTKMKDVDKGVDEMDKAVDLAPDNISVRLMRGINSVNLPSMFHRLPVALKDFEYMMSDPRFAGFNPHLQATIYCWAGIAYNSDNQTAKAKELLQKAISADPNSEMARKAESELKKTS